VDLLERSQPGDHPAQQHDGEVGGVFPDALVVERHQLVSRGGEPHDALAVHGPGAVHVTAGQLELELSPERPLRLGGLRLARLQDGRQSSPHHAGSQPSWATVSFSVRTLVSPALSDPISRLFGQQLSSL